jgi:hypothetical protein
VYAVQTLEKSLNIRHFTDTCKCWIYAAAFWSFLKDYGEDGLRRGFEIIAAELLEKSRILLRYLTNTCDHECKADPCSLRSGEDKDLETDRETSVIFAAKIPFSTNSSTFSGRSTAQSKTWCDHGTFEHRRNNSVKNHSFVVFHEYLRFLATSSKCWLPAWLMPVFQRDICLIVKANDRKMHFLQLTDRLRYTQLSTFPASVFRGWLRGTHHDFTHWRLR